MVHLESVESNILLVVDISNLAARGYFAAASGKGDENVFGLARHNVRRMVKTLVRECGDPLRRIAAFDAHGETFRHRLWTPYKGQRGEKPQGFVQLRAALPEILAEEFGFECYEAEDREADDVIATIADQALPMGWRTVVCSNDRDLLQLVHGDGAGPGTFILQYDKGAYHSLGTRAVTERMGVPPHRIVLKKAIEGDTGDNFPGVPGLGPVAAGRIARQFATAARAWEGRDRLQKSDIKALEAAGLDHLLLMERLSLLDHQANLRTVDIPAFRPLPTR